MCLLIQVFPIPYVQHYVSNYTFETMLWDSVSKYLACCNNSIVFNYINPEGMMLRIPAFEHCAERNGCIDTEVKLVKKQAQFGHKLFKGGHTVACTHHWCSSCKLCVKNNNQNFW